MRNCVQRKDEPAASAELAQVCLFLLRAYQWHPEQLFVDRAVAYLRAYEKYFKTSERGRVSRRSGDRRHDRKPGQVGAIWEAPIRIAKAAALAYSITGDAGLLEMADGVHERVTPDLTVSSVVQRSLIPMNWRPVVRDEHRSTCMKSPATGNISRRRNRWPATP